ncbi:MAG: hypothetical protein V4666_11620 [Bacteroidota bacterium]
MIKYITIFLLTIFISCKNDKSDKQLINKSDSIKVTNKDNFKSEETKNDSLSNFSNLVPLEIVDSTSENIYKKYGIELGGNCYRCDLAKIKLNKKNFDFINVCNPEDFYRINKFSYIFNETQLKVVTDENEFIFTKIDDSPVYKLKIKGNKFSLKDKIISFYYTHEDNIHKFNQHDCGDFDG